MEVLEQIWTAIRTGTPPDLGVWSYVFITILVFLEGPSVTLVAGAMAASGILRVDLVFVAAAIGNFLADYWWYSLGYFGGSRGFIYRFHWFQRRREQIEKLEAGMHEHGVRMYLMAKVSLGLLTIPTLLSAGLARVPWYRLVVVSLIVEPIWTGFLVFAGYNLGQYLTQFERGIQIIALIGGIILLLVFIWFYRRMFRRITHMDNAIS
ncbi:MAG: VTT domain-containing protein [Caldilinea sp.]|nr:VTT domain-containing protein [Caldilineaceae bacterium]MCW5841298.1 VTT domain-containing protein [Caldilinea sp.]